MLFVLLQGIFSYNQSQVIFHGLQNSAKNQTPCNRNDNANKFTPSQKISCSEQSRPVMSLCCFFQQQVIPSIFCESPKLCFLTLTGKTVVQEYSHDSWYLSDAPHRSSRHRIHSRTSLVPSHVLPLVPQLSGSCGPSSLVASTSRLCIQDSPLTSF